MKKLLLLIVLMPVCLLAHQLSAASLNHPVKTVSSPENRVALLELYTSEGCSSCPPADRFLSSLKHAGISDTQLIPMAFHVTYWDYIGWQDRFANLQYDQRQQALAHKSRQATVYTPQFVFAGDDYRRYASFSEDVNKLVSQKATVNLVLNAELLPAEKGREKVRLTLSADMSKSTTNELGFYFAVLENNLSSKVKQGENKGTLLQHDYVVRELFGPYYQKKADIEQQRKQSIVLDPAWKWQDISFVVFAENPRTGEVLQALRLKY